MIAYRDGKKIMLCEVCYEPIEVKHLSPALSAEEDLSIETTMSMNGSPAMHYHHRCGLPKGLSYRCPDCVNTGEEVCTHG